MRAVVGDKIVFVEAIPNEVRVFFCFLVDRR